MERGETVIGIDEVNDYYDVKVKEQNVALLRKKGNSKFAFYSGDICDKAFLEAIWATHGKPRELSTWPRGRACDRPLMIPLCMCIRMWKARLDYWKSRQNTE